jgi:DNA-binding NarL/FixJ family response regulator
VEGNGLERNLAWRVVVVDDHAIVRRSLRELIELSSAWECCGEADSGEASLRVTQGLNPDVVIMDVSMPGIGGIAAARAIHAALPNVKIILHTLHKSAALIHTGLTAGATGYVVKTDPGNEMLATLEAVMRGEVYVTPSFGPELIAAISKKISEKKRAALKSGLPDS